MTRNDLTARGEAMGRLLICYLVRTALFFTPLLVPFWTIILQAHAQSEVTGVTDGCRAQYVEAYHKWQSEESQDARAKAEAVFNDLSDLFLHPPPNGERRGPYSEEESRDYHAQLQKLGERVRDFGGRSSLLALSAFYIPTATCASVEERERRLENFLRFLLYELVTRGAAPAEVARAPLESLLSPSYTLPRFAYPGEVVTERLALRGFRSARGDPPFLLSATVTWTAGGVSPPHANVVTFYEVGGWGCTGRSFAVPQDFGDWLIMPSLNYQVSVKGHDEGFAGTVKLDPIMLTVTSNADECIERTYPDRNQSNARLEVQRLRIRRQGDLGLAFDLKLTFRVDTPIPPGQVCSVIALLKIAGNETRVGSYLEIIEEQRAGYVACMESSGQWSPAARIAPGRHSCIIELRTAPAEARHAGLRQVVEWGTVTSTAMEVEIRP